MCVYIQYIRKSQAEIPYIRVYAVRCRYMDTIRKCIIHSLSLEWLHVVLACLHTYANCGCVTLCMYCTVQHVYNAASLSFAPSVRACSCIRPLSRIFSLPPSLPMCSKCQFLYIFQYLFSCRTGIPTRGICLRRTKGYGSLYVSEQGSGTHCNCSPLLSPIHVCLHVIL